MGGPYDGVYLPAASWDTQAVTLVDGTDVFVSSDNRTMSVRVAWAALGGCPTAMRLAAHVVHAAPGNEWKELVPATTTPWLATGGGLLRDRPHTAAGGGELDAAVESRASR